MQFKTDKRSLKTRKAIKLAFLKILKTKDISEINITEITNSANINRNSFYTHYKSINNILDDINTDICNYVGKILERHPYSDMINNPYLIINEFSRVVANNNYIAEYLIFSKSSNKLVRKLKNSICDKFYQSYLNTVDRADPMARYMINYVISGVFEMYYVWFTEGKQASLDEVGKQVSKLILSGTSSL